MTATKETVRNDNWDYMFACCPKCRTTLVQAQNGMNGYVRCSQCGTYIHVVIKDYTVFVERKQ